MTLRAKEGCMGGAGCLPGDGEVQGGETNACVGQGSTAVSW